jgi:hypothetical protein
MVEREENIICPATKANKGIYTLHVRKRERKKGREKERKRERKKEE